MTRPGPVTSSRWASSLMTTPPVVLRTVRSSAVNDTASRGVARPVVPTATGAPASYSPGRRRRPPEIVHVIPDGSTSTVAPFTSTAPVAAEGQRRAAAPEDGGAPATDQGVLDGALARAPGRGR